MKGVIDNSASKMWISNFENFFTFARSYDLSIGDLISYTFNFYTANAIPGNSAAGITLVLPITPSVGCYVSLGLEDVSSCIT